MVGVESPLRSLTQTPGDPLADFKNLVSITPAATRFFFYAKKTEMPLFENSTAGARPIPLDAPVMMTTGLCVRRGICITELRLRPVSRQSEGSQIFWSYTARPASRVVGAPRICRVKFVFFRGPARPAEESCLRLRRTPSELLFSYNERMSLGHELPLVDAG